jgi:hypothetical protein
VPGGVTRSTSWLRDAIRGAIGRPATSTSAPIVSGEEASASGAIASGSSQAKRRCAASSRKRIARAPQARPAIPLPTDHTASSTPASAFEPSASLKAGTATSIEPRANPTGRLANTSVRRPGSASAPSPYACRPSRLGSGPGRPASRLSISRVPVSTQVAETSRAYWGPAVATIAVVTSGPTTNTISISTESSANAPPISSGRSASR